MENQEKRYDKIAAKFAALRDSFNTEKKFIDQFIRCLQPGHLVWIAQKIE